MRRTIKLLSLSVILAALLFQSLSPQMTVQAQALNGSPPRTVVSWLLVDTQVSDPGQLLQTERGTQVIGYSLISAAKSQSGSLAPEGQFHLTINAFSPNRRNGSQKAARWYVQGSWTIVSKGQIIEFAPSPMPATTVKGKFKTVLDTNPAEGQGGWSGIVFLLVSSGKGNQNTGQLIFDDQMAGVLTVSLK